MVGMIIDRPVREDQIGLFGFEKLAKGCVVGRVNHGLAVELIGVERSGLQDLAGLGGLADSGKTRVARGPFAFVQVEQYDLVTKRGIAGNRASTAIFRITRVTAGDDHLELAPGTRRSACQRRGRGQRAVWPSISRRESNFIFSSEGMDDGRLKSPQRSSHHPSGVKPRTTSNLAASSPIREPGIGAKSTVTDSRALGSRMLL